jgi:hypothetical protein
MMNIRRKEGKFARRKTTDIDEAYSIKNVTMKVI